MNTKFYPQWLRLMAVLSLFFAALASVSSAYAGSCLVTTDTDSGAGSLREKIADPICDTITFDGDHTIVLASHLTIDRNVTIDCFLKGLGITLTDYSSTLAVAAIAWRGLTVRCSKTEDSSQRYAMMVLLRSFRESGDNGNACPFNKAFYPQPADGPGFTSKAD